MAQNLFFHIIYTTILLAFIFNLCYNTYIRAFDEKNFRKLIALILTLIAVGDGATTGGLLGFLPGNLGSVPGGIADIFGVGTLIYRWQVEQTAASGTGIIMYIQTVETTQSICFTSQ